MTADPHRSLGAARVAVAAILWGLWPLALRPAGLPALQSATIALLVLALPAPFVLRGLATRDRGALVALLIVGIADAGNVALYFAALSRGPVAVAVLTHYLTPILVTLVAPLALGDRWSRRSLIGALGSLGGLALVLGAPAQAPVVTALLGAGSAVCYAAIVLAAKRASRALSPVAVAALHSVVSAAVLALVFGRATLPPLAAPSLLIVAGAVVCGLGATNVFYSGLARVPAPIASALTYLEPVSAAIVGSLAFGETLRPAAAVGVVLVVGLGAWVALEPVRVNTLR